VWLLGRRDPDDYYSAADVTMLKTMAHQTAIALTNIVYAERLRALYQNAIDQREAERVSLSRELHDNTLQRLFELRRSVSDEFNPPVFDRQFEAVAQGLAQTIRGLRPPMLEYGLYRALVALVDDWANRPEVLALTPGIAVECAVPESETRYLYAIEQHLYRIVQQAGDNALEHAGPRRLTVTGRLEPRGVTLTIEDDGRGFDPEHLLNLSALEAQGHFGLAGMQERAALIGARIQFDSAPARGTRIHLEWRSEAS
jgi:signal transduction histidine kinase